MIVRPVRIIISPISVGKGLRWQARKPLLPMLLSTIAPPGRLWIADIPVSALTASLWDSLRRFWCRTVGTRVVCSAPRLAGNRARHLSRALSLARLFWALAGDGRGRC